MEFKFPKGAKLLTQDDDGRITGEEDLEGAAFEMREMTRRDQIQARQHAKTRGTDPGDEMTRMSFTMWRGQPVKQPFAEFLKLNNVGSNFVEMCWGATNGDGVAAVAVGALPLATMKTEETSASR